MHGCSLQLGESLQIYMQGNVKHNSDVLLPIPLMAASAMSEVVSIRSGPGMWVAAYQAGWYRLHQSNKTIEQWQKTATNIADGGTRHTETQVCCRVKTARSPKIYKNYLRMIYIDIYIYILYFQVFSSNKSNKESLRSQLPSTTSARTQQNFDPVSRGSGQ